MAKCCDRCDKPINKNEMAVVKFTLNFRQFINNIDIIIQRKREGINDYDHLLKTATGKWELCKDCCEGLSEFMLREEKN